MTTIDRTRPVMVTGANGYVASWLVKRLLDDGLTVHAAVRNPNDEKKIAHLKEAAAKSSGQIKFFAGDLLKPGSYKAAMEEIFLKGTAVQAALDAAAKDADSCLAMEGCELVYHTASPFTTTVKDPQKELIDPAVKGTENVLRSATEVDSVKRVVVTSSCAAIYGDAIDTVNAPGGKLTEEIWNTTSSLEYQPYSFSKTLAENPGNTTSESINILKMLGGGEMKMGAPRMGVGLVDVRDVAEAHFKAGFTPTAKGRYITSAHSTDLLEMGKVLLPKYGDRFPLPTKALPKWLLMIIGPFTSKLFTRPFIRKNVDVPWNADNSKIKKELGITFRPMKETMEDSFQNLIDEGILKAK